MVLLLIFSISCFLYPAVSDFINSSFNDSTINDYNENIKTTSDKEIENFLFSAKQYNKAIATE